MKVLIVTFYFPPEMGAAANRISNLAEGLQHHGAQVDILSPLPNYPKGKIFSGYRGKFYVHEKVDGHHVFRYWTYATVSKNPIKRAVAMFTFAVTIWCFGTKRELMKNYDCILVQSPPLLVSYSAVFFFKKIFHKCVILNVSDIWPLTAVELGVMKIGSLGYKFFSHCEKYIYENADSIMGQSEEIIEYIDAFVPDKNKFLYRNLQPKQ